jgi:hypothetical protein
MAPTRPVSGATIAAEWGQAVHDATFAPKGFAAHSTTSSAVGSAFVGVNFDIADDDPGGWLDAANDRAVAPAGSDGEYIVFANINTVSGTDGDLTMGAIYINGAIALSGFAANDGGTNVPCTVSGFLEITAGDIIQIKGRKRGAGSNPTLTLTSFKMVRAGEEFGA